MAIHVSLAVKHVLIIYVQPIRNGALPHIFILFKFDPSLRPVSILRLEGLKFRYICLWTWFFLREFGSLKLMVANRLYSSEEGGGEEVELSLSYYKLAKWCKSFSRLEAM